MALIIKALLRASIMTSQQLRASSIKLEKMGFFLLSYDICQSDVFTLTKGLINESFFLSLYADHGVLGFWGFGVLGNWVFWVFGYLGIFGIWVFWVFWSFWYFGIWVYAYFGYSGYLSI